jgi:hypothetical protein
MRNSKVTTFAAVALSLLAAVQTASAQKPKPDPFRQFDTPVRRFSEKQPPRVGQRMASQMLDALPRFKGLSQDSAAVLLYRQSRHHIIVLSQCDFELRLSRQNASPGWQALSDSVARDARRIVRHERLTTSEINEVLNRAARMARFCMDAGSSW